MPKYVYTGEDTRTYEDRALVVSVGDTVEWPDEEAPDYRWSEEGSDEAVAAIAVKEAREIAEAAEQADAAPSIENARPDVPPGTLPEDNVEDINAYLSDLQDGEDPDLYESERQRLITDQTRKGLIKGPHADPAEPNPETNDNADGSADSNTEGE